MVIAEEWGMESIDLSKIQMDKTLLRYNEPERARSYGFLFLARTTMYSK